MSSPSLPALRSMMSMNWSAALRSCSMAMRKVSTAERNAATGVRSSCETLATKSRRTVSSRRISVTSNRTSTRARGSPERRAALTRRLRGLMPPTSISFASGSLAKRAFSTMACNSALRMTSMVERPATSESSSSISRRDGLARRMRCSPSMTRTPSRMDSRMRPRRSRSSRSSRTERERLAARWSRVRPSSPISSGDSSRLRASSSPLAMRRATAVRSRRPRERTTAAADDINNAASSATRAPPSSTARVLALARSTHARGKLTRATIWELPGTFVAA